MNNGNRRMFDPEVCARCCGETGRWRWRYHISNLLDGNGLCLWIGISRMCFHFPVSHILLQDISPNRQDSLKRWMKKRVDPETDIPRDCPHLSEHILRKYELLVGGKLVEDQDRPSEG